MWVSNVHTSDFILNPLFLKHHYPYYIKVPFDHKYRYNAISIGQISDWTIKFNCKLSYS